MASGWVLTEDVEEFLAGADGFLRAQRAQNTVLLTASETLRIRGPGMFGARTRRCSAGGATPAP